MEIKKLKELLFKFEKDIVYNQDLKKKNWFNIGGKTKVYYKAEELKDLIDFLKTLDNREKVFVIGAGSNTLVSDDLFDGIVIKLGKNFSRLSLLNEDIIISGAGVLDKNLADYAADNGLSGFEFLGCIPGTIGGGIKMNAGCFGSEIKDILVSIQVIDKTGNVLTIPANQINFEYRNNDLSEDLIFISASFKGQKENSEKIKKKIFELKKIKNENQPTQIKTSGSTFKNPVNQTDKKVWELIRSSVSQETSYGDAVISKKHANFFVNKKNAKASDMKSLINFVKKKVKEQTGIKLELEIVEVE